MDMALATLDIDGKPRKVLIQAPKNGFVYVIDRVNGELISAKPFVKTSWATGIDLKTGRPNEASGAVIRVSIRPAGRDILVLGRTVAYRLGSFLTIPMLVKVP